ncbi:methyl-accepting chemotaxis protein [Cohnella silvisoli]|uniref:Methyl-accepting chemotaxis protein n=1 Tax=Cohnella silvisoli TaxID=2873699 RepID=A0ABV1KRU6_9BACL|nr:methyl-accepting chemotaxis protein [Cohnella silvisoli]MCD9022529.1 methyl-accepting chemotaxis protein [Cohnella silvisoli]
MIGKDRFKGWSLGPRTIQNQFLLTFMSVVLVITITLTWVSYAFSRQLIADGIEEKLKSQAHQYVNEIENKLISTVLTPQTLAPVAEANGTLGGQVSYEDPYLDQTTGTAMVKVKVPYFDENATLIGVTTADIPLDNIQQLVGSITVGRNGSAIMIDKTGLILSSKDYAKMMTEKLTDDPNKSLADLARQMLASPAPEEAADGESATSESVPSENAMSENVPSESAAASSDDGAGSEATDDTEGDLAGLGLELDLSSDDGTVQESPASAAEPSGSANDQLVDELDANVTAPIQNIEGMGTYENLGRTIRVYYVTVPDTGWLLALTIPESELYGPLFKLFEPMISIIIVSCVIVALFAHLYSRYILKNIRDIDRLAIAMSEGDFTKRTQMRSGNELQRLGDRFNQTLDGLCDTMDSIAAASHEMSAHADQMKSGTEETTRAAEEIANSIQNVSEGAEREAGIVLGFKDAAQDVLSRVKQINAGTERMSELAMKAKAASEGGNQSLTQVIQQMDTIHYSVQTSSEYVLKLKQSSNAIDEIVAFITSVASQTSLLALNAAIEAARAGEAGKGFSVVSMEIRKLADQSSRAAGEISGLLSEIQGSIAHAALSMDEGTDAASAGIELAREAEQSFGGIGSSIEKVTLQAADVYDSIRQIVASTDSMAASVQDLLRIAAKNANDTGNIAAAAEEQNAAMQQVAASAAYLASLSRELKEKVQPFKKTTAKK